VRQQGGTRRTEVGGPSGLAREDGGGQSCDLQADGTPAGQPVEPADEDLDHVLGTRDEPAGLGQRQRLHERDVSQREFVPVDQPQNLRAERVDDRPGAPDGLVIGRPRPGAGPETLERPAVPAQQGQQPGPVRDVARLLPYRTRL
jgi:hypothetical protein